jgi:hypothetical protein
MDMWMMLQALRPGVQHSQEPDLGSKPFRIGSQFEQRFGRRTKQNCIGDLRVL